jgi:hypothetical protein
LVLCRALKANRDMETGTLGDGHSLKARDLWGPIIRVGAVLPRLGALLRLHEVFRLKLPLSEIFFGHEHRLCLLLGGSVMIGSGGLAGQTLEGHQMRRCFVDFTLPVYYERLS